MNAPVAGDIWLALPVPGIVVGADDRISGLNPAAEMFLNQPSKLAIGQSVSVNLGADVALTAELAQVRRGGAAILHREVRIHPPGSGPVPCDLQIAPLGDPAANVMILLQPRRIAGELGRALRIKSAAKTAIGLADMLAHEIKNPLAGINGAAQLLAMNLGKADRELTDLILQESRRIVDLLHQVEQFGDMRPPDAIPLNIHDILERARASARIGSARNMQFRDDYDPSLPAIAGDAGQLLQVMANLFANAAEAASPAGGVITIRTFFQAGLRLRDGDGPGPGRAVPLQIEVSDDGPGVPQALQDSLFDPFVSSRENGTGLGLALVSKIITAHGGAIALRSDAAATTFRVSLPFAAESTGET